MREQDASEGRGLAHGYAGNSTSTVTYLAQLYGEGSFSCIAPAALAAIYSPKRCSSF